MCDELYGIFREKCVIKDFHYLFVPNSALFMPILSRIATKLCMLTVVYLSILQHKLVFVLHHGTFTDSFTVGVITRSKVN